MIIPNSAVVMLLGLFAATVVLVDGGTAIAQPPIQPAELQRQMEDAAGRYERFATFEIISNWADSDSRWPKEFTHEQAKLLGELKKWSTHPGLLRAMIRHQNPKVRTLALGALFVREDPHDLPLIASLANDQSPTFTNVERSLDNTSHTIEDAAKFQSSQTVGNVAERMLAPYLRALGADRGGIEFSRYWKERESRKTCASWVLVKLDRATRRTSPLLRQYRKDCEQVIKEVKGLPLVDRVWTQIFLRSLSFPAPLEEILTDADCIASLKEIGPDQVVRFLQRKRVTDDPDICFDDLNSGNEAVYSGMAHFILRQAPSVLRVQDAQRLLACEQSFELNHRARTPAWAAAAAELTSKSDLDESKLIIDEALQRFPRGRRGHEQAALNGCLWKICGAAEKEQIVDWFYQPPEKSRANSSDIWSYGLADFLRIVREAGREDTTELMAALVNAPRFEYADLTVLKELSQIASQGLPEPLVSHQVIFNVPRANIDPEHQARLAEWRKLLIRHYQQRK